jgi:hypothetical protein
MSSRGTVTWLADDDGTNPIRDHMNLINAHTGNTRGALGEYELLDGGGE